MIGRFPGETSALSLIWAVLELSSRGWRGVKMNPKTVAEIERLRRELRQRQPSPSTARYQGGDRRPTSPTKRSYARAISPGNRDATITGHLTCRFARRSRPCVSPPWSLDGTASQPPHTRNRSRSEATPTLGARRLE